MTRMTSLFLIKEDVYKQHWSSNGKRYNVGKLYDYAKAVTEPEDVPLSSLKYGFEHTNVDEDKWSPEFTKRAREANFDYPILVVRDRKDRLWIADGNHRYGKAVMWNMEMIAAYVVDEKGLPDIAVDPDPTDEDESSHKRQKSGGYDT